MDICENGEDELERSLSAVLDAIIPKRNPGFLSSRFEVSSLLDMWKGVLLLTCLAERHVFFYTLDLDTLAGFWLCGYMGADRIFEDYALGL